MPEKLHSYIWRR